MMGLSEIIEANEDPEAFARDRDEVSPRQHDNDNTVAQIDEHGQRLFDSEEDQLLADHIHEALYGASAVDQVLADIAMALDPDFGKMVTSLQKKVSDYMDGLPVMQQQGDAFRNYSSPAAAYKPSHGGYE